MGSPANSASCAAVMNSTVHAHLWSRALILSKEMQDLGVNLDLPIRGSALNSCESGSQWAL